LHIQSFLSAGGSISQQLLQVTVPTVSIAQCNQAYGAGAVDSTMLCAGVGGKDSCQVYIFKYIYTQWFHLRVSLHSNMSSHWFKSEETKEKLN
jgi:hypothetical protein